MNHKEIEELSLNHWQPLSTLLYDGWVLRFADGYTKRANSISPLHESSLDLHEKIQECQNIYAANQLPAIFKITPFIHPPHLDTALEEQGFSRIDTTLVQTLDLSGLPEPTHPSAAVIQEELSEQWLDQFCSLNEVDEKHRSTMKQMLSSIRTRKGFISLYHEGRAAACGFGVIERNYIGLYDIVTDRRCRSRGLGEQMLLHLLKWGREHGAAFSYLAVVADNAPALRLYSKLGYREIYKYWYRVK